MSGYWHLFYWVAVRGQWKFYKELSKSLNTGSAQWMVAIIINIVFCFLLHYFSGFFFVCLFAFQHRFPFSPYHLREDVVASGFPGGSDGRKSACDAEDLGLIPGSGRSPGGGNSNILQYACLLNFKGRGPWWASVHGVAKSQTRLSDQHTTRW